MKKILTNEEILKEINRVYEGSLELRGKDYGYADKNMIMRKMRTQKYKDISEKVFTLRLVTTIKSNMILVNEAMKENGVDNTMLGHVLVTPEYMIFKQVDYKVFTKKLWGAVELMEVLSDIDHGFLINAIKHNIENMAVIFSHVTSLIALMIQSRLQETSYKYIESKIDISKDSTILNLDADDSMYNIDEVLTTTSEKYVEKSLAKKSFIVSKVEEGKTLSTFDSLNKILDVVDFGEEFDIVSKYSRIGIKITSGLRGSVVIRDKDFRDDDIFYNAFKESGNFSNYEYAYDNHRFTTFFTMHISGYIVDFITVFTNDGTSYTFVVNLYTIVAVSSKEVKAESVFRNGASQTDILTASHLANTVSAYITETLSVIAKHLMNKDSMMNLGDVEYVVKSTSRSIVHTKNVIRHYDNQTVVIAGHMRHYKSGKVALVKPHLRTYSGGDVDVTLKTKIYIK
ncbi:MAG: hypothetical protein ACRC92_15310 [Peptostreptococcaceae bacterium]